MATHWRARREPLRTRFAGLRRRRLVAVATAIAALAWAPTTAAGTFGYRKAITFGGGSSGVNGGPHASFPVLISLVDADLRAKVASPNGYDIVFRGESSTTCGGGASSCALDHEIEHWDPATGTLLAWVRVPLLSAGTTIHMYYGSGEVRAPTETPRAVWDAGYVAVWHLGEDGSGIVNEYRDSSRYANHGRGGIGDPAATPTVVPNAMVGRGQHFGNEVDGRYALIDGGNDGTVRPTGDQLTLEAWVRHGITIPSSHDSHGILNVKGYYEGYRLVLSANTGYCGVAATAPCLVFGLPGVTHLLTTPQNQALLTPSVWHHVVATYDGSQMGVFVDGRNEGWRAKSGPVSPTVGGESVWIGHGDQPQGQPWSGPLEGDLDEVRISRVARSTNWIATQFNNQSSSATFYSVGSEEAGPHSAATLAVNHRSIGTNTGDVYATGAATVAAGATTVTFAGATLPDNVGTGDVLTFTGAPTETAHVLSRDSATQLTLEASAVAAHVGQGYAIKRAYNSLAAWETARQGDLVAENRRELGVTYDDGPFMAGVTIDGSTTDAVRSIVLTVAPGQRHLGRAGTGAVLDNGGSSSPAIRILDDHVTVEWLEIRGGAGTGAHGVELAAGLAPANLVVVADNVIHHTGGDGVRVGDPDSVVDIRNNVVYEAGSGVRFPVDMAAHARANVFNNTIYGGNAASGPSGVVSDVRQTSPRIDLRNNIAHGNAGGDFGVSPFFDAAYFCNPGCTQIANGGVLGPTEFLADRSNDFTLGFTSGSCLYLGSSSKFRGVNAALAPAGVSSGANLAWSYWNGSAWASLETAFYDGTAHFQYEASIYWPDDPAGWTTRSVSGSPLLYYVQACLAAGSYLTAPTEEEITRIDVAITSRNNLAGDHTGMSHNVLYGGQTGLDLVPLASVGFVDTTPGAENLHITPASAAADAAADLGHVFVGDIDGAPRTAPWDIGADDVLAGSGPDVSITKARTSSPPVVPGTDVTYRMTVTNVAGGTVTSLKVTDTLPPEMLTASFTPQLGSYEPATGVWSGLSLAAGQSVTLDLQGRVAPGARGTLVNSARVDPPAGVVDPDPANDSASTSDLLEPWADLHVTKSANAEPADLGSLLTYTLEVRNDGPSAATGVVLTDTLPPPTEFDSVTYSQGSCSYDPATRALACALGAIPCNGIATVTLTVRPMALGTLTNSASADGVEPDPDSTDDVASVLTMVEVPSDGVPFFTVTSTSETNALEWLNPTANYAATEVLVRTDRFPTGPGDPGATQVYYGGTPGEKVRHPHATGPGSNGQTFYYAAFVHLAAGPPWLSSGRFVRGRPFDTTPPFPVKWAFSTGGFSVTPPTVGGAGVIATSNDTAVHAMARGAASPPGGEWPAGWRPFRVLGPVQSRSPVVPIQALGPNPVVFLGSQDGRVYMRDAAQGAGGALPWTEYDVGHVVQAAPAGLFKDFGADDDLILVGTRDTATDNALVAIDPLSGAPRGAFTNGGGIGIINGMAAVDYARPSPHVYFASRAGGRPNTLWCQLLVPLFTDCPGWTHPALGDIDSSPVVRGGRVYVGSAGWPATGTVYSVDAATGTADRSFPHDDGQVKGFVFPDRNSDDVYFATDNKVWSVSDTEGGMVDNFPAGGLTLVDGPRPSAVLFVPGSHYLYVGASNGRLYEIDVTNRAQKWVELGDGKAIVGTPSLDRESGLVHVGTEAGVFYAVAVPLP